MKLPKLSGIARIFLLLALLMANTVYAAQRIPVGIDEGTIAFRGDLYLPKSPQGLMPLVIVVHEWWGKSEYSAMRAKKIADELGYAALAVDLYGEAKVVETPKEAQALAGPFYQNPNLGVARLKNFISAALVAAQSAHVHIDPLRVAAIGYCFGGTQVLNLARAGKLPSGEALLGVVSFHGGLASTLSGLSPIEARVLVLHGAADKMVGPDEVAAFKEEMKRRQAALEFHAYPGALHAFTNPQATQIGKKYNIPIAYNAEADHDSWSRMKGFLEMIFKK